MLEETRCESGAQDAPHLQRESAERRGAVSLPTPRALTLLIAGVSARVSVASVLAIAIYLYLLLDLSSEQWAGFAQIVGGLFVLLFTGVSLVTYRMQRPVRLYLERDAQARATDAQLHAAYWTATRLALWMSLSGVLWWAGGGALVAGGMSLLFDSLGVFALSVMIAAATSGGVVCMVFSYYLYKAGLADLICELGDRIHDPEVRRKLQQKVSLRTKTVASLTSVMIVVVFFAMQLALVTASRPLERFATGLQARFLERASARYELEGATALPALGEELRQSGIASGVLVVDTRSGQVLGNSIQSQRSLGLREDELASVLAGPLFGDSNHYDSPNAFAWRRTRDDRFALVTISALGTIRGEVAEETRVFGFTMLVASLLAAVVARFLAADVASSARDLRGEVDLAAAGDLRPGRLMQSEDELGDLAVAYLRMRAALCASVSRVCEAADLVDATADRIRDVSESVETSSLEQGRTVQRIRNSMQQMEGQVSGIAATADELGLLVEDSTSSVGELGTSANQLTRTAASLVDKVGAESSSIQQMVRSVEQVSENTDSLAHAAAETSSSMEEMASSMREVDSTAEQAAQLSLHVVDAAEAGQATMAQTIEAMESIRSATDMAEDVVGVLGGRAQEIGAIVGVIDDVADETNLLALNAAIIAAQAGEQGRAFSVVANEIKELADRVQVSTKEIGELIQSVQGESANAVQAIGRGASSVAIGMRAVADAGESLHEITRASRESGERITQIVRSVREHSKAAIHVVEMMEQVNDGTLGIRRAITEQGRAHAVVYESSIAMREVAQQIGETILEQGNGTDRIRESIGGVFGASESIRQVLKEQAASCSEVVGAVEGTSQAAQSNEECARQLSETTRELIVQAESLRDEVKNFKL